MEPSAMESISARLSSIDDLYFPRSVQLSSPSPSPSARKTLLLDLLSRDAPIFLERYGPLLTPSELRSFDALSNEYEVRFHLSRLRLLHSPTPEDQRSRSLAVKNRRRAYLERLVEGGEYFSEEAMRDREPYLHHEMLGRFQDPIGRVMSRPGERWSETLLRQCEEAEIAAKIRGEQKRRGVDRKEWVGGGDDDDDDDEEEEEEEESEKEEESEDDDRRSRSRSLEVHGDEVSNGCSQRTVAEPFEPSLTAEEMQEQLDQFTRIMHQKFLAGEDTEHLDYSKIDNDERLDDHWHKEASQDEEERYFDED